MGGTGKENQEEEEEEDLLLYTLYYDVSKLIFNMYIRSENN